MGISNTLISGSFAAVCDSLGVENNTPAWPDRFGEALRKWLRDNNVSPVRTLSLFSGAGGLDIGFSDIGFDIVESVEIEKQFCNTLELNTGKGKRFEHSRVNCIDIREFSGDDLGHIDFIIGGPPCQTFSAAGRRANGVLGTTDARGVLFREYVRLLQKLAPKGFLFENVYGIIGAQNGAAWQEIREAFSSVGYNLFYRIVDAADYGAPQHRERLLIVGLKEGEFLFPKPTHGPDSIDDAPFYNAETAIEGVQSEESLESNQLGGRYASLLGPIPPGLNYSFYTEEMGHPKPLFAWRSKFSDFLYKADPNVPVRTIKASGGAYTGPFHWENRFFTLEEYKRLQTFPDDYVISGKKQTAVKQIGNSVPPQLARIMAIAIRQQVFGTEFSFTLPCLQADEIMTFRKRKKDLTAEYKKKAYVAIRALESEGTVTPVSHQYFCKVTDNFQFSITEKKDANHIIDVQWGDDLTVSVLDIDNSSEACVIEVEVAPAKATWNLGVKRAILRVCSFAPLAFTVAWKAFEHELVVNGIKADLVQLNGYYQYPSKLQCRCLANHSKDYPLVLSSVIQGTKVSSLVSTKELASVWGISEEEVMGAAQYLRRIGYEVRNHSTNPQIDSDYWLIPYCFPTLTQLSVQLWKRLQ